MYKCAIFDFDGTLVQSNEIKKETFYEVTQNFSELSSILDKILSNPDSGDRYKIFDTLIKSSDIDKKFGINSDYLSHLYTSICELKIAKAPEVKGAYKTLIKLKNSKIKIFISSATPLKTLKKIIIMRGWEELFDDIYGHPDSKESHLREILSINRYKASEAVYIGDSDIDRRTALVVGCKFIGIGLNYERFKKKPDTLMNNLNNLYEFFEK